MKKSTASPADDGTPSLVNANHHGGSSMKKSTASPAEDGTPSLVNANHHGGSSMKKSTASPADDGTTSLVNRIIKAVLPNHGHSCEIKNNSTSIIYLTAKTHADGDSTLPGEIRGEATPINPQQIIKVDKNNYDLSKINTPVQQLIYLSLDPKGLPATEGGAILLPNKLPDGGRLNLYLEGNRVTYKNGGQQQADSRAAE